MLELNDEKLRQATKALESYEKQLESLSRQIKLLQATCDETTRSFRALGALATAKKGDEIMIPVGAMAYVTVMVTGKNAVVGIGNGIAVEKTIQDAQAYIQKQSNNVTATLKSAVAAMQEIRGYAQELTNAVQQEYHSRQTQNAQ